MGVWYHLVRDILVGMGWLLIVQEGLGLGLCRRLRLGATCSIPYWELRL